MISAVRNRRQIVNWRRATAWRNGCVAVCLAVAGMLRGGILESPPVSLDDIRWKKFQPASEVYIDTTLQFTPAFDALPGVDATKDKLAIWLNVDTSGAPHEHGPAPQEREPIGIPRRIQPPFRPHRVG